MTAPSQPVECRSPSSSGRRRPWPASFSSFSSTGPLHHQTRPSTSSAATPSTESSYRDVRMPTKPAPVASAARIGSHDGCGNRATYSGVALATELTIVSRLPSGAVPRYSSAFGTRSTRPGSSQSGWRLLIGGMLRTLYGAAGSSAAHSSPSERHGFLPAGTPRCFVQNAVAMHDSTPATTTTLPSEDRRFRESQPSPDAYVYTRRGIPSSPVRCIGRNVVLKPTKSSQNVSRPPASGVSRPV